MKTCKDCRFFEGLGDFGLCCDLRYDLCYEDTPACEEFGEYVDVKGGGQNDSQRTKTGAR